MHDQAILDYLDQQVDEGLIAGAVVGVCEREGLLSLTCSGMADREAQRPMREDTLFWIASCSKPMVVTAIMSVVEQGLFDLDDPVEKHLPMFKDMPRILRQDENETVVVANDDPITIRQCLSHTSGLPFLARVEQNKIDRLALAEAVVAYASSTLLFKPGTAYSYGNAGINSVSHILELKTGTDFNSYMNNFLLEPLGMHDTSIWPSPESEADMARCYGPNADASALQLKEMNFVTAPFHNPHRGAHPGGCYFSTVKDTLRFCQMILNDGCLDGHQFISADSITEMTRQQTGLDEHHYGLGWGLDERGFGHGGAASTHLHISPDTNRACVYFIQQQGAVKEGHGHILPWLHQEVFGGAEVAMNRDGLISQT